MEGGFHTGRLAALQFSAYQSEPLGEPSDGVEPVQDMTSSGKITTYTATNPFTEADSSMLNELGDRPARRVGPGHRQRIGHRIHPRL